MEKQLRIILSYRDEATSGLAKTIVAIQGAIGGMQTVASKGFSAFTGIVSSAVSKVTGFFTGLVQHMKWASFFIGSMAAGIGASFVSMAAGLEQTRVGFETLLKDEAKVKDALTFIQKWALETPFSVTEATDSFKRFLAVTGDLDLTKKYLQNLGDAVVATGGNINEFNFAARAMTQIQAMSKVRAQEMYQLVNANIPAFDILAKAIKEGKLQVADLNTTIVSSTGPTKKMTNAYYSASEKLGILSKRAEAAQMRLQTLKDKGKENTAAFKSAEASVMSTNLAFNKAKNAISVYNTASANATTTINTQSLSLEEIKGKLQDIGDLNIKGSEAAKIFSEYFEQAYGGAAKKSTTTLRGALGVLKDQIVFTAAAVLGYNQITGKTYGIYAKLKSGIETLTKFLQDNKKAFEDLGKTLQANEAQWTLLGIAVGIFFGFLGGILGPVIVAGVAFGFLGFTIGKLVEHFGGLNTVINNIKTTWVIFSNFLNTSVIPPLQIFAQAVLPSLQKALEPLLPALQQLGFAFQQLGILIVPLIAMILVLSGAILTGLVMAIATILPIIINILTGIITLITGFLSLVYGLFTANGEMIKMAIIQIWSGVMMIIGGFINLILGLIMGFIEGVMNYWNGLFGAMTGKTSELVNNLTESFTNLKNAVLETVKKIVSGVSAKFGEMVSSAWGWGSSLVSNFIRGVIDEAKRAIKVGVPLIGALSAIGDLANIKYQHGGIVPGPIGAPVPAIVHGGERIVPRGGETRTMGNMGEIVINMNGPITMDTPERIKELAREIKRQLGRENELAQWGLI